MSIRRLLALPALCLALGACNTLGPNTVKGAPPVTSAARTLQGAFTKIDISGQVDAAITVGGAPSLQLEGYSNLLPLYQTEVSNGVLKIFLKPGTDVRSDKAVKATITLPSLTGLQLSGASHVQVGGTLQADEFTLNAGGATEVSILRAEVQSMAAEMDGAARLNIAAGSVDNGSFKLNGNGVLEAAALQQRQAIVALSGAGEATVWVSGTLHASVSGAGTIRYKGRPQVTKEVSGAGKVEAVD